MVSKPLGKFLEPKRRIYGDNLHFVFTKLLKIGTKIFLGMLTFFMPEKANF